jgi:predicted ester cyclase
MTETGGLDMTVDDTERRRRRALLKAHYDAENDHNLDKVLATFADKTEMIYNGQVFDTREAIGQAHTYMGFSGDGALADLRNTVDHEHFTDDAIVVEGRAHGIHRGEFQGFPPTNRPVELPFVAFYRFDARGKLISERVVMNLASLGSAPTWEPK